MTGQLAEFDADDDGDRDHQRQHVIDHAVEHQRAENGVDIGIVAERRDDDRLEDAKTGRHMAQDADADGQRIDRKEGRPADRAGG